MMFADWTAVREMYLDDVVLPPPPPLLLLPPPLDDGMNSTSPLSPPLLLSHPYNTAQQY
jgi:hypothetical protein